MSHSANRSSEAILALVKEVEEEAAGGAEALFMAAMLAPSALPYDLALAVEGAVHNPSLANPAAAFFAATATMEPLVARELVDVDPDAQAFAVPEDVRLALRENLSPEDALDWAGRAVYALNLILPDAEPEHWDTYRWLMPHILACRELVADLGLNTAAANRVLHQTGFSLYHRQRFAEAADFLEAALAVDLALKGRQHPDICADLEGLGTVLWSGRDLERAENAFASCLELQKTIFTEDNPMAAPVLNSLAVVRQAMGKFDQAEADFRECLRVLTRTHGEGHPAIASCLSNFALLCEAMGKPQEALRLAERSLAINRETYGGEHPEVAADLNTVALLHESVGNDEEAEKFFRESLAVREKLFGEDHPETGQSLCNLALFLDTRGRHDEALFFYERGLAIYENALGPDHPLMESTLDKYILLLEKTGARPSDDRLRATTEARLRRIVEKDG